jgi:hypothetical protein
MRVTDTNYQIGNAEANNEADLVRVASNDVTGRVEDPKVKASQHDMDRNLVENSLKEGSLALSHKRDGSVDAGTIGGGVSYGFITLIAKKIYEMSVLGDASEDTSQDGGPHGKPSVTEGETKKSQFRSPELRTCEIVYRIE